jgi:hypothetical protein
MCVWWSPSPLLQIRAVGCENPLQKAFFSAKSTYLHVDCASGDDTDSTVDTRMYQMEAHPMVQVVASGDEYGMLRAALKSMKTARFHRGVVSADFTIFEKPSSLEIAMTVRIEWCNFCCPFMQTSGRYALVRRFALN